MKLIILTIFVIAAAHAAPYVLDETKIPHMDVGTIHEEVEISEPGQTVAAVHPTKDHHVEEKPMMPMKEEEKPKVEMPEGTIIEEIETSEPGQSVVVAHPPKDHHVEEKPTVGIIEEEIKTSEPKQTVTVTEYKPEDWMNIDPCLLKNQFGLVC